MAPCSFPVIGFRADLGPNRYVSLGAVPDIRAALVTALRAEEAITNRPPANIPARVLTPSSGLLGQTLTNSYNGEITCWTAYRPSGDRHLDLFVKAHEEGHVIEKLGGLEQFETALRAHNIALALSQIPRQTRLGRETIGDLCGFIGSLRHGHGPKSTYLRIGPQRQADIGQASFELAYRMLDSAIHNKQPRVR